MANRLIVMVAAVCLMALVTACGAVVEMSAPPSSEATATPSASGPPQVFSGLIDITADRHLKVECLGAGSPTILLEAGGTSSNLRDWPSGFVASLAAHNVVCAYSRAGGPGSDPVDGLLTRDVIVSDAFTLLDKLRTEHGVNGPYLLVGWSFGGSVALAEALEDPDLVAGVLVLDTDFPADFMTACQASGRTHADCAAEYADDEEAKSIEADIVKGIHRLTDMPFEIVSAMVLPECSVQPGQDQVTADIAGQLLTAPTCDALAVKIADKQRDDWGEVAPQLRQTRVQADHDGLIVQAGDQIIRIVDEMVAGMDGTALPRGLEARPGRPELVDGEAAACIPTCGAGRKAGGQLPAGRYQTQWFFGGYMTIQTDGSWGLIEDSNAELSIPTGDNYQFAFVLDPQLVLHGEIASDLPLEASAYADWLAAHPDLVVSEPEATTIGSIPALAVDVRLGPSAVAESPDCGDDPCVNFIRNGAIPAEYQHLDGILGDDVYRFVFADIAYDGTDHLLMLKIEGMDEEHLSAVVARVAPIVASVELPAHAR